MNTDCYYYNSLHKKCYTQCSLFFMLVYNNGFMYVCIYIKFLWC